MTPEEKRLRLEEISSHLAAFDAYYPSDADLWPAALKYTIEATRDLLRLVKEQEAVTGIADDLPYRIVEEMGLGLTFRSCSCGQLPCARLRPLRDALEAAATAMRSACVGVAEQFRELIQYESDEAVRESIFGDMVIKMEGVQAHD